MKKKFSFREIGVIIYMQDKSKKKIEVYLTESVKEQLRKKAKTLGITMSEVLKRMLEEYLK